MNIFDLALMELAPGLCYTGTIETKQDFETKCYRIVGSKLSHSPSDFGCTWEDLEAKIVSLQKEYDALQYQRDRQYPSIGDQLDMQYHDELNGTTTWKDAVAKVKSDNPKG